MKKLKRSRNNKIVAGVSGGVATYFGVDPVVIRLVLLFVFIVTGFFPLILMYALIVFFVPVEDEHDIVS